MYRAGLAALIAALCCPACAVFYDEGARFAVQTAIFATKFRKSQDTSAVFVYTPKYGADQKFDVGIGQLRFCPHTPCYHQGAATVNVERGKSGTGYRIPSAASVPRALQIERRGEPVRVLMRKSQGDVEIVGLQ